MSDNDNEIRLNDLHIGPIRMTVYPQPYRNAVGIGFITQRHGTDQLYAADMSGLVFRRIEWSPTRGMPGFESSVPVSLDHLDMPVSVLAEISGNQAIYKVSEAERKAVTGHIEDLRTVANSLLAMQREIISRVTRKGGTE